MTQEPSTTPFKDYYAEPESKSAKEEKRSVSNMAQVIIEEAVKDS